MGCVMREWSDEVRLGTALSTAPLWSRVPGLVVSRVPGLTDPVEFLTEGAMVYWLFEVRLDTRVFAISPAHELCSCGTVMTLRVPYSRGLS